jgi:pyrroline-5-carboxylate reductase
MTGPVLPPLLLIGGGKMGGAMLAGWRELGLAPSVVVDPSPAAQALAGPGVTVVAGLDALPAGFAPACVVLAVKPQHADQVLPALVRFAGAALFISIMAGRTLGGIRAALDGGAIVRAMPNTPAAVRQGITVGFAGPGVSGPQRALADQLLSAVGQVAWVEDEALIDPVTAISGGGPAYVFLLAEMLEKAGLEQGLPPALARQLARATVAGSGALLGASTEDAAALRIAVTSPKGTTERALGVLMAPAAWPMLVPQAIEAATHRSRELAG